VCSVKCPARDGTVDVRWWLCSIRGRELVVHVPRRGSESELGLRDATIRVRRRYAFDYNTIMNAKSECKKKRMLNVKQD
jgi:hypothetical protein